MKKAGVLAFITSAVASLCVSGYVLGDAFLFDKTASDSGGNNSVVIWSGSSSGDSTSSGDSASSGDSSSSSADLFGEPSLTYKKLSESNKYGNEVTYHIIDMELTSIYELQTHLVTVNGKVGYGNSYKKTVSAQYSDIAADHDIRAAMNGDFAFFNSSMDRAGYVIRNGIIYRSSRRSDYASYDDMVISYDGSVSSINEADTTAEKLLESEAYQVFDFGPALLENGAVAVSTSAEVDQSAGSNPRSVFGYLAPLHYLFFVSEGRLSHNNYKDGFTLYEVASILKDYGCSYAYNLDGGGSSTLIQNGTLLNKTCNDYSTHTTERAVSDCIYVTAS